MAEAVQPTPYIGQPLRRREDYKFLTGKGRYVDDINLPGTLYLAILRSPHAHARITGIELSVARAIARVRLVLAGTDLNGKIGNIKPNWVIPGTVVPDRPVMALDKVRFVGECVALVVGETREAAYDALELIDVAYEVLRLRLVNNRLIPTCLETRAILAAPGVDGGVTIYLPSQVPHMHRRWITETV